MSVAPSSGWPRDHIGALAPPPVATVPSMLPSEKAEPHLRAVQDFGAVLDDLIPLLEPVARSMVAQSWAPKEEHQLEAGRLIDRANELCGTAARALAEARVIFQYQPPPMTGQPSVKVNPVQNWAHIFEPIPMFSPQELRGFVRGGCPPAPPRRGVQ
jgi:hypothetical protein